MIDEKKPYGEPIFWLISVDDVITTSPTAPPVDNGDGTTNGGNGSWDGEWDTEI